MNDRHRHRPPCHQDTTLHCMHTFAAGTDDTTAHEIHVHTTESIDKHTAVHFLFCNSTCQPANGAVGHQKRPDSRPDQPRGLPVPAEPPSPACSSQRLALAGSSPYLRVMTLVRKSMASSSTFQPPGVTEGEVRVPYRSHFLSGPRTHNGDPTLKCPGCDRPDRLKWEACRLVPHRAQPLPDHCCPGSVWGSARNPWLGAGSSPSCAGLPVRAG